MANRRPRMRNNIEDLCYLMQTANLSSVEQLLVSGQVADTAGRDGFTPLMWSVEQGDTERLTLLLKYGANINKKDKQQRNCLHLAVLKAKHSMVSKLCKLGIDKNAVDSDGLTPLMTSLMTETSDITHTLIKEGVDVNAGEVCISELSALHLAVLRPECHKVVSTLLHTGANVNRADSVGRTPLVYAIKGRYIDVARTLLEHSADPNKSSPLNIATQMSYSEAAALLLSFGADPAQSIGLVIVEGQLEHCSLFSEVLRDAYVASDSHSDQILESMISEDGISTSTDSENYMLKGCQLICQHGSTDNIYQMYKIMYRLLAYGLDTGAMLTHCKCKYRQLSEQKCEMHLIRALPIQVPLPLFVMSRNKVRQCLGKGVSQKAKQLNIPQRMRKSLTAKVWDDTDWLMNSHKLQV